jgi:hypothetical protein
MDQAERSQQDVDEVPAAICNKTQIDTADARIDALRTWRCTGNSTVKTESGDNRSRTLRGREIAKAKSIREVAAISTRVAVTIA